MHYFHSIPYSIPRSIPFHVPRFTYNLHFLWRAVCKRILEQKSQCGTDEWACLWACIEHAYVRKMAVHDIVEDWKEYFTYLTSFLRECIRQQETTEKDKVSYFCERLECFIRSTQRLLNIVRSAMASVDECEGLNLRECTALATSIESLVVSMRDSWLPYWQSRQEKCNGFFFYDALADHAQTIRTGLCVIRVFMYMITEQ